MSKRTEIATLGEFGLIRHLTEKIELKNESTVKGVGDDAAVLDYKEKQVLVTTDLLLEGIHFDLTYVPLKHLGYKSAVVNFSDIYAMNGKPKQITVSLGISKRFSVEELEEFYSGLQLACDIYGVDIVGGDTSASLTGLCISITCIGEGEKEKIVTRNGAKDTDLVCVSGDLGAAYMGLQLLEREKRVFKGEKEFTPDFTGKEYLQYVGEDFLASQSSAKQAQLLAESLMEVRDAKISLTRGTAETMPTDGRQLELMLQSLSDQEAALTAAFAGTESKETLTRTFTFRPEKAGKKVLFRLSDFAGFVAADDYSGEPVYIRISDVSEAELPTDADGVEKKLPKDAVVYAIPGSAKVTVYQPGQEFFARDMQFAQFGTTFGLAPALFTSKKEPSYAIFDPATGALREIAEVK